MAARAACGECVGTRPCRLGTVETPKGQFADPEVVLDLAMTGPAGCQPGQPRQSRSKLTRAHVALEPVPSPTGAASYRMPRIPHKHQELRSHRSTIAGHQIPPQTSRKQPRRRSLAPAWSRRQRVTIALRTCARRERSSPPQPGGTMSGGGPQGRRSQAPGETRGPRQASPHPRRPEGPQETSGTPSGCTRKGGVHESQGFTLGWVPAARQAAEHRLTECANPSVMASASSDTTAAKQNASARDRPLAIFSTHRS